MSDKLPYPQRDFIEMVADAVTDSMYMSMELAKAPPEMALPSYVAVKDPFLGMFKIEFKIEKHYCPGMEGVYDVVLWWRYKE